ncbi:MAG: MtrB/PioB family decaheme-associated outer membrane protein [Rubrivivax sp.]
MRDDRPLNARPTLLALALLTAFAPARAEDAAGIVSEGSVSVGLDLISGDNADRAQFGQYNGLRTRSHGVVLFGLDYSRRNLKEGDSLQFWGTNLSLQTRELGLSWKNQGRWKLGASYNEQVHYDPYSYNTGGIGFGTTTPQVTVLPGGPGTGVDKDLKVTRNALGLDFWKSITPAVNFAVKLKTEDRAGSRLYGNGFTCPSPTAPGCIGATGITTGSAVLMLPEPIDSNTTQIEARVSYADRKMNLSAGYYGSFYSNHNSLVSPMVPDRLNNGLGTLLPLSTGLQAILNQPLSLPPDNQAQFLDITGNYVLSPETATQAKFKLSYAWGSQNQSFSGAGYTGAPAGVASLGGSVNTGLVLVGISSRPIPKLALLAELRYERKKDSTPIALYNVEDTDTYTNRRYPLQTVRARFNAGYQFNSTYRGTLDVGYESLDRGTFTPTSAVAGVSALRQRTDETSVKVELRRRMTEEISGAISYVGSRRNGSNWLQPNSGVGVTEVTDPQTAFSASSIFMPSLADRQRDLLKISANWQVSSALSLSVLAEGGQDSYSTPTDYPQQGLRKSDMNLFSVDADYAINETWRANGYLSWGNQQLRQSRPAGYILSFKNTATALGAGITGMPTEKWQVGVNLAYVDDQNAYSQTLGPTASPANVALLDAAGGLPDVLFRQFTLGMFGKYDIDKRSAVRVTLVYQYAKVNDWAWNYNGTPYALSDGTTLFQQPTQSVAVIGVTYSYRF